MCGIFGYVGSRATANLLIEALKRLEYRGYDSWGIALAGGDELAIRRQVGRITTAELPDAAELDQRPFQAGIAHTRWATHGPPPPSRTPTHTRTAAARSPSSITASSKTTRL